MKIAAVSDVTLGYGTPQLPLLVSSLRQFYDGTAHVVEPVQPEVAARHGQFPDFQFHPVVTGEHPHGVIGRSEYVVRAARELNRIDPDILVVCCTYSLPVVFKLRRRPRKIIYYSVESIPAYGSFDIEMNRRAAGLLDLVLFPEENRASIETARCGFPGVPKAILFNVSNRRWDTASALERPLRNGRVLYSGTISRAQTFANYYLSEKLHDVPIDLYGPVKRQPKEDQWVEGLAGDVRYGGYLSSAELAERRPGYVYSVVSWNPDVENQHYAAPNKFFESIAAGVPPIAAPHPQCKLILERYECGILLPDWSFEAFVAVLHRAMDLYPTRAWEAMVANCRRAVERELNWEAQFEKVTPYL